MKTKVLFGLMIAGILCMGFVYGQRGGGVINTSIVQARITTSCDSATEAMIGATEDGAAICREVDFGTISNATLVNPTISGAMYTGITGTTQCYELDEFGVPHGTGAPCGAGEGGGGGMTNPMTAADDIIVGGPGGTATRKATGTQGNLFGVGAAGLEYLSPTVVKNYLAIVQSDVSGLTTALNSKMDTAGGAFTGTVTGPTPAVDSNNVLLATTAWMIGQLSNSNPNMDGSASSGSSLRFSRYDHRHPSDTSKLNVASPTYTGTMTSPVTGMVQGAYFDAAGHLLGTGQAPGTGGSTPSGAGVPNWNGTAYASSYTVGTSANNLVQLNSSSELPAVSGANLTLIPPSAVSGLTTSLATYVVGGSSSASGEMMCYTDATGKLAGRCSLGTGIMKLGSNSVPAIATYLQDVQYLTPTGSAAELTDFPVIAITSGGTGTTGASWVAGDMLIASGASTLSVISKPTGSNWLFGVNNSGTLGYYQQIAMNAPFIMGTDAAPVTLGYGYFNTTTPLALNSLAFGNGTSADYIVRSAGTPTSGYILTSTGDSTLPTWQEAPGGGNVSNSGTPTIHQWALWTDATHVEGVSVTGSKVVITDADGEPTAATYLTDMAYVSDATYSSIGWDADTTHAPSKNAIRDILTTLATLISPAFTTPDIGAATGTSLIVTGVVDGLTNVVLTTSTSNAVESPQKLQIITYNNYATAGTAVTYTMPTAAAGKQRCYGNYTGKTGAITVNTSASGQYIDVDGVNTASGGYVTSGGALGDKICFTGVDSTHWVAWTAKGTWAVN